MAPKCNYMYLDKREAEGDLTPCQGEGDVKMSREREDADPGEGRDVHTNHWALEDTGQVLPQSLQRQVSQQTHWFGPGGTDSGPLGPELGNNTFLLS